MKTLINEIEEVKKSFDISDEQICEIAHAFYEDLRNKDKFHTLDVNGKVKTGNYLAIDFGGSNIRIKYCRLFDSQVEVIYSEHIALRGLDYDYTTSEYSLSDIFDMCAQKILEMDLGKEEILLGHTFSFATMSLSKNVAKLIAMSKGFELKCCAGQDINELLTKSLIKYGLYNIVPVAIINDTTASLLYGHFLDNNADIAFIIGTGHNVCYINNQGFAINVESGGFNHPSIPLSAFEKKLVDLIPEESSYLLETLVGGKNIDKLANIVIDYFIDEELIEDMPPMNATTLSMCCEQGVGIAGLSYKQSYALHNIACAIFDKRAKLIVAEIIGILNHIDPNLTKEHTIIFDGSVYKYNPYLADRINENLARIYRNKAILIKTRLVDNASFNGAIVAAAT